MLFDSNRSIVLSRLIEKEAEASSINPRSNIMNYIRLFTATCLNASGHSPTVTYCENMSSDPMNRVKDLRQ